MTTPASSIDAFVAGANDASMRLVATQFMSGDATVEDVARLASVLASSGAIVPQRGRPLSDVASTGGPGSLTTLLAPLLVRSLGGRISKIAVPGRPAGGLDVLGSLFGYRLSVDLPDAIQILDTSEYLHVSAGDVFCPLDAQFFGWRQKHGFQAIPDLAIASLLAKKIAAGVSRVVFDVRVGPFGNFGADRLEASRNSRRLVAVAASIGIEAVCCISSSHLAQPFVGRGEAARALATVLQGNATGQLEKHACDCLRLATLAVDDRPQSAADLSALLPAARKAHEMMLTAHGVDLAEFESRVNLNARAERWTVAAEHDGYFSLDVASLRTALVDRQSLAARPSLPFPDPCGVELLVREGDLVRCGQPVMAVRADFDPQSLVSDLAAATSTAGCRDETVSAPMEIIRG